MFAEGGRKGNVDHVFLKKEEDDNVDREKIVGVVLLHHFTE